MVFVWASFSFLFCGESVLKQDPFFGVLMQVLVVGTPWHQ